MTTDVLIRLRDMGYRICADGGEIVYRWSGPGQPDPDMAKPLLMELRGAKSEALALLRIEMVQTIFDGKLIAGPVQETKPDLPEKESKPWDPETAQAVAWFTTGDLPTEPFELWPWLKIPNPQKYYEFLSIDIAMGPSGPRTRYGSLQSDMRRLFQLFGTISNR